MLKFISLSMEFALFGEMICIELICFDSKVDIVYVLKKNNLQLLGEVKCFGASEFASFMKRWYALSWFVLIRKLIGLRLKKKTSKIVENV